MNKRIINRRAFLSKSTVCIAGVGIAGSGTVYSRQNSNREQQQPAIREYRMLGRTGFKVSDIGCGYPGTASESVLKAAIAGGINFIDSYEIETSLINLVRQISIELESNQ